MTLDGFRKGLELIRNKPDLIAATKANLERTGDADRIKIFNEVFGNTTNKKK